MLGGGRAERERESSRKLGGSGAFVKFVSLKWLEMH